MFTSATLVSLILGVLGLFLKWLQDQHYQKEQSVDAKVQELRKNIEHPSGLLDDQHTRVQQALHNRRRDGASNNNKE